jgi:protein ImuB
MPRIACVRLPGFVLQVHLRGGAASADAPVAVSSAVDGAATARRDARRTTVPRLVAVSRAAAAAGIQPGMTVTQAQATLSSLILLPFDEPLVRGTVTTLAESLLGLSPTVEPHPGWFFLVTDARLAHAAHRLVESLRFAARVAVADERFTAAAVAHAANAPVVVVTPGDSAAALAPLPLGLLPLTTEIARGLHLLGLRTLGDFARLTEAQVAARWGRTGVLLHRLTRGIDPTPLRAFSPPARLTEELRLDPPVTTLGALDLGLARITEAVALRLQGRGSGATHVTVVVTLDHAPTHTLTLRPTRPIATARPLHDLVGAMLGESRFAAPVTGLTVVVDQAVPVKPANLDLFAHRRERAGHELDMCLVRLRAFLGEPAVHGVKLTDSYRPEAMYERVPFALPAEGDTKHPGDTSAPSGALRLLDPPVPVDLVEGPPPMMRAFGDSRRIAHARGPLRVSGEWWRTGFARDYFEVILEDGAHYWLYRDESGCVFAQGVMD